MIFTGMQKMYKNIKVIAMDLDGTLTQHKTLLSAEHRAVLTELSAIIIAQNMSVDEAVLKKAQEEGVTILRTSMTSYELCTQIGKHI